jgi:hypothetical protein
MKQALGCDDARSKHNPSSYMHAERALYLQFSLIGRCTTKSMFLQTTARWQKEFTCFVATLDLAATSAVCLSYSRTMQ